jgi:Na+/H+ antiporter NhaC
MNAWLKALLIIEPILLVALIIFAVLAYRSNRSVPFLLLMFAAICYFVHRFAPFAIGFALGRGTNASASIHAWYHSWWSFGVSKAFDLLFLLLLVASFISFVRASRKIAAPHA